MLSQQIIQSGQIVQLTCQSSLDGNVYYVIGKRFDKKCIYLVEEKKVENVSNFDNSFFEVQRSQSINNKPNNQIEIEKDNKPIKFGDEIKFKHMNSGKYLSVARQYTERSKGSFKILLDEGSKPSEITFQIMPHRSFEKLADPIKYKSKVNIYNQQEEIYLNIERNSKDPNNKIKALVATHMADSQWQINLYAVNFNPINDVIRDKDLVYIVNSKSSGLLTLAKNKKQTKKEEAADTKSNKRQKAVEEKDQYHFVLKQLPLTYPIKKQPKSFDCIWQISIGTENPKSGGQMGKIGGPQLKISFTHLIEETQGSKNLTTKLISSQEGSSSKQSLTRKAIGQTITSGQYIRIGNEQREGNDGTVWLGENNSKNNKTSHEKNRKKYLNRINKQLTYDSTEGDSIVFQVVRIPEDLKKEIYEFIEAKQRIQSFIYNLSEEPPKQQQAAEQESDRFKQAQEILKHITESLVFQQKKNTAYQVLQRQMILNDIGFINIIMECLQKLTARDNKIGGRTEQSIDLRNRFHDVLRHCCTGNKEIKLSLSTEQHLLQLLKPSNVESNDTSDIETLKEIMKDNKYAIQHVMNQNVVKEIIRQFEKKTMQIEVFIKYIQILRLICKTTDEVIPRNQKLVIEQLLERRNIRKQLLSPMNFQNQSKNLIKKHSIQKPPPLIDFFFSVNQDKEVNIITPRTKLGESKVLSEANEAIHYFFSHKDHPQQYLACLEWIDLISDVCENKNVQGKKFAEERFGPRVVQAFIYLQKDKFSALSSSDFNFDFSSAHPADNNTKKKVKFGLLGYIVRLVNNAYIKTIYRKKIFFDRIYISGLQSKSEDIYSKNNILAEQDDFINKIKVFINRYIISLKVYLELHHQQNKQPNKDTTKVIEDQKLRLQQTSKNVFMLMKNMIMYGLYNPSEKQQQEIQMNDNDKKILEDRKIDEIKILEAVENTIKNKKGFMYNFLIILCYNNANALFKSQIMEIVNFYMNLDLRQRVDTAIKEIKQEIARSYKVYNSSVFLASEKKNMKQQRDRNIIQKCQEIMEKHQPKRILPEEIKIFIIIMLSSIQSDIVKNKADFILSLNTLSKFIQVNRIYTIRVKETLIIDRSQKQEQQKINTIRNARNSFEVCEIKDLKGISLKDQYQLNIPIWDKDGDSIIKFILTITKDMKDGGNKFSNIDDIYKNTCSSKYLLSAYNEFQRPNPKIQKMVREMKLHRYFFSFIKEMTSEVQEELSNKLLQIIYLCLAVFTWKNYSNKTELNQLFPYMLAHAEHNNGSIEALKQFFSENPSILYDEKKITKVTERITNYIYIKTEKSVTQSEKEQKQLDQSKIKQYKYNFYYAAKLLDFLHSLIAADSNKQGLNRILVLSYILDKDRLKITRPQIIEKIIKNQNFKREIEREQQKQKRDERYNAEIAYLSVLFGLLAQLVDQESINIAKCKKLHKLEELVDIMSKMKYDIRLKASARDYANKLYYVSMDSSYIEIIIASELDTFVFDLGQYIFYRVVTLGNQDKYYSKNMHKSKSQYKVIYAGFKKMDSQNILGSRKEQENPSRENEGEYKNPIRYSYKSTYFYLNIQRTINSLELILEPTDGMFAKEVKNLSNNNNNNNDDQIITKLIELYRRLRFICINFFYDNISLKKRMRNILNRLETIIGFETEVRKRLNTDLRIHISRRTFEKHVQKHDQNHNQKHIPYQIVFKEKEQKSEEKNEQLMQIKEEQNASDMKKESLQQDIEKIKMENYMSINRIVETMLKPDIQKEEREETLQQVQRKVISQLKYKDAQDSSLYQIYLNVLKAEQYRRRNRQQMQSSTKVQRTVERIIWDQFENVFKRINIMIYQNYEIFEAKNLTFYFRTILKELSNKNLNIQCLTNLSDTFSQLMFKTVTSCNLQENIEVSYWFFEFVSRYWDKIKTSNIKPEVLYRLIKQDYKNEFLIKLNDFIVFLSNDIDRKVRDEISSQESPLKIFDTESQSLIEVKNIQYGALNKEAENSRIFNTFKNIFQFMHLLCQNNFVAFKSQFRQQKLQKSIKPNNRNLLIRSTIELRKLFRMYCMTIQDIPEKILDFINQIAQIPCYDNQIELSKSTFFEDMCLFITETNKKLTKGSEYRDRFTPEQLKRHFDCVCDIIERFFKILLSLLESNINQIYESLLQKLSSQFFDQVNNIHISHPQFCEEMRKSPDSKIGKLRINMLIIWKQLDIKSLKDSKLIENLKKLTQGNPNQRYSIRNIESIEVRLDDKEHKLYFFKPIEAEGIDKNNEFIQTIEQKLDRSTHLQKLDSLLLQRRKIEMFMVYQHQSKKEKYSVIHDFISLNTYASVVSVFINIVIMMTTSINIVGDNVNSYQYYRILLPFQIIQFILGTLFFFSDAFNHIMKSKFDKFNNNRKEKGKPLYQFAQLDLFQWITVITSIIPSIIYYFICILGLFVSPYYYSIHILFLFAKIKVLENVFKAITNNILQLVYLALLGIAFFVVFSILSIDTYAPYAQQQYCNSIWQCFLVIYNKDLFIQESENTQTNIYSLLFQILYSVFFGALFGNIISGLMTDTFAELRDKQNYITEDESNSCYICGRSRFEIERENKDRLKMIQIYEKHIMKHNKLSYVFYLYELENKAKTQYTGLEYIISKRLEENSVVWFPISKKEENQDISQIKKELEKLQKMV